MGCGLGGGSLGVGVGSLLGLLRDLFRGFGGQVDAGWVEGGGGEFEFQALEGFYEEAGDGHVAEPLVVGGDEEPRGAPGAGALEDVLVGDHVVRPELALLEVGEGKFPVFGAIVDAGLDGGGFVRRGRCGGRT